MLPNCRVPVPSAPVVPVSGKDCRLCVRIFTGPEKLFAVPVSRNGIAPAEAGLTVIPIWPLPSLTMPE